MVTLQEQAWGAQASTLAAHCYFTPPSQELEPGWAPAGSFMQVSGVDGRDSVTCAVAAASQGLYEQEAGAGFEPRPFRLRWVWLQRGTSSAPRVVQLPPRMPVSFRGAKALGTHIRLRGGGQWGSRAEPGSEGRRAFAASCDLTPRNLGVPLPDECPQPLSLLLSLLQSRLLFLHSRTRPP